MTEGKNKGGRPRGSGKDDSKELNMLADMMVRNPDLRMTTAIKKLARELFRATEQEAAVRRLQRKWADSADERMAEARLRQQETTRVRQLPVRTPDTNSYLALASKLESARQAFESPRAAALLKMIEDGTAARMMERFQSPTVRALVDQAERLERLQDQLDPVRRFRGILGM